MAPIEIIDENITLTTIDEEQKSEVLEKLSNFNRGILNINRDQESSLPINYNLQANGVIIGGVNAYIYFSKTSCM
jgi:hypothetical protein